MILLKVAAACAWFLGLSLSAGAAEWQWSAAEGEARAYLWIPPECRKVRGLVLANHNMIEQGILEHPKMRETLAELGFAEMWVVPYLDIRFDFNRGAGERFQKLADSLAERSGYEEISTVPVVPLGHSACASFPWNFAAGRPERTLAVLSIHGDAPQTNLTGYGGPKVEWGDRKIDGIPGLMTMGEYEWSEERRMALREFVSRNPGAPIAFLGEAGRGHFYCSARLVEFLSMFLRKAAAARLPLPGEGEALRPVSPEGGWLVEEWHFDGRSPAASPAAYGSYTGDRAGAFWTFDRESAEATEQYGGLARGKMPQLLAVWSDDSRAEKSCGEPVTPRFLPEKDGITFQLHTGFLDKVPGNKENTNAARWARSPVGSVLGHADAGEIRLSPIVGPVRQTGPRSFQYSPGRAEFMDNRRNHDMWILAEHPGDGTYKSVVQQVMVKAIPNGEGKPQDIRFPEIHDVRAGASSVKLEATSDSGEPVRYFVREGPAEVEGDLIRLTRIPPGARFPMEVTVVAWQSGRAGEPKLQSAAWVERRFRITR